MGLTTSAWCSWAYSGGIPFVRTSWKFMAVGPKTPDPGWARFAPARARRKAQCPRERPSGVWSGAPPTLMAVRRIRNPIEETFYVGRKIGAKLGEVAVVNVEALEAVCIHARRAVEV